MAEQRLPLDEALRLRGPHQLDRAPTAYSYNRARSIGDDRFWLDVLADCGVTEDQLEERLGIARRELFERSWNPGGQMANPGANVVALTAARPAYVHDGSSVYSTTAGELVDVHQYVFQDRSKPFRRAPVAVRETAVERGCALRFRTASGDERWYHPIVRTEKGGLRPAEQGEFFAADAIKTWRAIVEFVQVFYSEVDSGVVPARQAALNSFTAVEVVRADAAVILRQFARLERERDLASALAAKALAMLKPDGEIGRALPSMLPELTGQYRALVAMQPEVEALMLRLADAAAALGYKLILQEERINHFDGSKAVPVTLARGQLYRTEQRTTTWSTSRQEKSHYTRNFWGRKKWHYRTVREKHRRSFTYYERVDVDYDPWVEASEALRSDGYSVFLLRPSADGMATPEGVTLSEVHQRCADSEAFRSRCVVGVPFYEETIIGERMMIGYQLVFRPEAPLVNEHFPEIATDEKLAYRVAWTGTSLGELVASIPLAPGEERQVTVTTSERFKTSRSIKTESLAEVTRVDRQDFETVFEAEVRKEKEKTQSMSASASGSYGAASGSANFSSSTTTKDMSRQLNRSVSRAAQEVTKKTRESMEVTITEEREAATTTDTSFKVKNINVGRTLNINLFKVLNDFTSKLVLEDFDFVLQSGPYLVAMEEFRETRRFSRSDLAPLFDHLLQPGVVPCDLSGIEVRFLTALCKRLVESVRAEYQEDRPTAGQVRLTTVAQPTLDAALLAAREDRLGFPLAMFPSIAEQAFEKADVLDGERDKALSLLARTFSTSNMRDNGLLGIGFEPVDFAYDSGALHADAQVGLMAATEEYSEKMRQLEQSGALAQQELVRARASYLLARAEARKPASGNQ